MPSERDTVITRIFDAPREMVWRAWTEPELISQWWGPEGFTAPSINVDLKVGGKYVYAMKGPEGSEWEGTMYSAGVYVEIIPEEKIVVTDYFSDENGEMLDPADFGQDPNFPKESTITVLFENEGDDKTKVTIIYPEPATEAEYQAVLKSGMTQGWQSSMNKLAAVVE